MQQCADDGVTAPARVALLERLRVAQADRRSNGAALVCSQPRKSASRAIGDIRYQIVLPNEHDGVLCVSMRVGLMGAWLVGATAYSPTHKFDLDQACVHIRIVQGPRQKHSRCGCETFVLRYLFLCRKQQKAEIRQSRCFTLIQQNAKGNSATIGAATQEGAAQATAPTTSLLR